MWGGIGGPQSPQSARRCVHYPPIRIIECLSKSSDDRFRLTLRAAGGSGWPNSLTFKWLFKPPITSDKIMQSATSAQ